MFKYYKVVIDGRLIDVEVIKKKKSLFGIKYLCIFDVDVVDENGNIVRVEKNRCKYFKENDFLLKSNIKENYE